jgi:acetyl-CoA C-acetyltransferase
LRSHRLAAAAQENGWFDAEITPVPVPAEGKQKAPTVLSADESIRRDSSLEKLARLPGAFKDGGSVTAGNSCGMTDGAAAGLALSDVDAIEVNEAFAAQVLTNEKMLGWDREKVNMHGGAIALGHPIGISGARIVVTLLGVLRRTGGEIGLAGICGAGGVSTAMVIRRET